MFNAHAFLGVQEGASKKQIIKAFHEKSRLYHPDKGGSKEMMQLLNKAHDELLQQLENTAFVEESNVDLDEILRDRIFEDLDDPGKRIDKRYRALHATFIKQLRQDQNIKNHSAYTYFEEFKTDLYCYVILNNDDELDVVEYIDLFDLIAKKEADAEECEELVELSKELSPEIAVEILAKFIEGKCFGENLIRAQEIIENGLKQISNVHPTYALYSGILGVLTIKTITRGLETKLLASLNKITDFARVNVHESMPYMALLFQSVYFRTLFTQALHLLWQECNRGFKVTDFKFLSNMGLTKSCLGVLSRQVIDKIRDGIEDDDLLRTTAYLKKLYEFEQFINADLGQQHTAELYRERGFDTLNWLTRLMPFANRNVIINILMQAGVYFQQASACVDQRYVSIKKADEKLALQAYMEANAHANRSAPDLEIYTLVNTLKFIATFKYQSSEIKDIVNALQSRTMLLVDIFPFYIGLQSNINLVRGQDQTLNVMRSFLQKIMAIFNHNKSTDNKISMDHKYITVLYQAYEACVKNWYQQHYDPDLENTFRLELMQLLLESNDWKFADLDAHLTLPIAIKRDKEGWMEMTQPLKITGCGLQTYASLEGVEINNKTGEVKFTLSEFSKHVIKRASQNTLTIYDVMEMLDKNVMAAHFSLDPVDPQMAYHPFNTMRFAPDDIYKTQFLNTMLLADYILKFLTIGQEVQGTYPYDMRSIKEVTKRLPKHLQKIIDDFHAAQQYSVGSIHRFWIEAEQLTEALLDDDANNTSKMAISDLKMVVKKHTMERDASGNLVDTQNDSEGWDLYVLTPQEKLQIDAGKRIIIGPAMLFVIGMNTVSFIEHEQIYKEAPLSSKDVKKINELCSYRRDANSKVIVTIDNSMFIYRLIESIATASEVPTHFSPEYIFAQEFTANYDEISEYILEFARLRELCKITAAVRFLNEKRAEATQRKDYYDKLLRAVPDWEQRGNHASNRRDYFDLPRADSTLSEYEIKNATFRHENAEIIKKMLPNSLYENHLRNLASVSDQIKTLRVNVNSSEITEICNDLYEKNRAAIIREHGNDTWNYNKDKIWREICAQKSNYVREINDARVANMRKQLYELFSKEIPAFKLNNLIDHAMHGDMSGFAAELSKRQVIANKQQLNKIITEQTNVLEGLKRIGLAREEGKHIGSKNKCLWVPASVKHHIAGNSSQFIYGGVRVIPRINVLNSSDPRHNKTINNAFNAQGRATVNSKVIQSNNNAAQQAANNRSRAQTRTNTARNQAFASSTTSHSSVHTRVSKSATSFNKGVAGETAQYKTMVRAGYEPQACKVNGNRGFDGVFVKRTANGAVDHIVISEAKYAHNGELRLGTTREKGVGPGRSAAKQMSSSWVRATFQEMRASSDPQVKATVALIRQNRDKLVYRASVLDPNGVNRWGKPTERVQELHKDGIPQPRSPPPI